MRSKPMAGARFVADVTSCSQCRTQYCFRALPVPIVFCNWSAGGILYAGADHRPRDGQQDRLCREATAMFCAMLGTMAGNLALSLGAQGGVYIAGDIVPKLGSRFAEN